MSNVWFWVVFVREDFRNLWIGKVYIQGIECLVIDILMSQSWFIFIFCD